jgi:7-cyano-7-deazaguanine reductase
MAHDITHVLGKNVNDYKATYDPDILAREARVGNRKIYGFDNDSLPFKAGRDIWHAYECNFLTDNGLPVNGVLKLSIPFDSEFIVESKSLKLYLFSYNMEKMGPGTRSAARNFCERVTKDISALLGATIEVAFFDAELAEDWTVTNDFLEGFDNIGSLIDLEKVTFDQFQENPDILVEDEDSDGTLWVKTDLLRSNCKITHQPDYGTIYIHMEGSQIPTPASIAQYIVSMRSENHFHEEIVECVYSRLQNKFAPRKLLVTALYTRRGGIDICPSRASSEDLLPETLLDLSVLTEKEYRS